VSDPSPCAVLPVSRVPWTGPSGPADPRLSALGRVTATAVIVAMLSSGPARALEPSDANKSACRDAYEASQLRRRAGELVVARAQLRICGGEDCPAIMRSDCVRWLADVELDVPSLVFEARSDGVPVFDASVTIDGHEVARQIDGRPIEIDPGIHVARFERKGTSAIELRLIVRGGEKNRLVLAEWTTPKSTQDSALVRTDRPVPPSVYITAAIGASGIAGFAIAGVLGNSAKSDLEASGCAPFCARDKVTTMRNEYLAADVGLGIAIAELVTSALIFATRPDRIVNARTQAAPRAALHASPAATLSMRPSLWWQVSF